MAIDQLQAFLLWCTVINYAILLVWFAALTLAHDWLYRMHSRCFRFSVEAFDSLNYACIAIYKIGIVLFLLVPLIALHMVDG